MSTRIDREREFHDQLFATGQKRPAAATYAIAERSFGFYEQEIDRLAPGRRVLEYGCGRTSYATRMAAAGASVVGIDISEVAVETSRARAADAGLEDRLDFVVMDAEQLELDERFDLICGTGILHHLDLGRALSNIAQALAPGGSAIFLEPLGHNPAINLYRNRTPGQRSEDEHPLMFEDIEGAGSEFGRVRARFFHLTGFAALALRGRPGFDRALRALDAVDARLFRAIPASRRWAWISVIVLDRPHAHA